MRGRILPVLLLAVMVSGCESCNFNNPFTPSGNAGSNQEVWVTPNVASGDLLALFVRPEQWENARSKISVFKFYDSMLRPGKCDLCGYNTFENLAQVVPGGAFKWLNNQGIKIAMEGGSVKPFNCGRTPDDGIINAINSINSVKMMGSAVSYIAMDEPFTAGLPAQKGFDQFGHCNYTVEKTAEMVKYYVDKIHAVSPAVKIGLIEPYGYLSKDTIINAINALEAAGARPAFFHLDFGPYENYDLKDDVRELRDFCQQKGIPFGIIIIGVHGDSNESAADGTILMAQRIQNIIGLRNQNYILLQSWLDFRPTSGIRDERFYPDNLPESSPSTMMGLVNVVLAMN